MRKIVLVTVICCTLLLFLATAIAAPPNEEIINAATIGDIAKVELLLKDGVNPNSQNAYGWTPLLAASASSRMDIAIMLVNAGANPNVASNSGETPLLYAVMTRNQPLINYLIEHEADPNKRTTLGLSPKSMAKQYGLNLNQTDPSYNIPADSTSLLILNDELLEKAKNESTTLTKYGNDSLKQFAYVIDDIYIDTIQGSYWYNVSIITPYSLAKYGFYKEKQIFRDFTVDDQKMLLENNNIVTILVTNKFPNHYAPPVNNLVIKKNGIVYKPINKTNPLLTNWDIGGNKYSFPIGLFDSNEQIDIAIVGLRDHVKSVKLTTKKLSEIK